MVGDNLELEVFSQLEIPAREELTISYLPSILLFQLTVLNELFYF